MYLVGDPGKHEMFVARFRYPDGLRVGPHWHTTSVHITVLSGTLMLGMGDNPDSTAAQAYGPGSFVVLEGGMHHYEWFRGETIVHVEGIGPFRTVFLNPADDPRTKP
jgi:quercetin dioxygenase-like cupin family protein